ncbi:LysR family transcriptional regulator [Acuticoccus sp. I52.16.1]|uniref:LysR family transcriptional regulator n=1 Tax=Acuticoccus sp. I52.16.1 TaxID=2928472 RepID=UPI001FD479E8|nr:LysR substrate-binding domain-containing protein [Acuticoccus sp. I52.16.1]UOM36258.1 LysR substrate-binding domain-containing protein [Acuticoccus sp. I52.16.1]
MTKRRILPIKSLIALESVVRTGSVSAAADDLSVTHGAVSKQLAHLEQWLGRPLFSGRRGGMVANAAGERLAAAVGGALEEIETALDDVLASDRQEVLTVVAPATFAMRWLIPRLPRLDIAGSDTGIRVRPTHTTEDWDALQFDLVVRRGEALAPRFAPRPLFVEQLGLLVPPNLLDVTDPARLPFVDAATRTGELARWCQHAFRGRPARPAKVYPHYYVALEAALAGLGAIVAPLELLGPQLSQGLLVEPWPDLRVAGAVYSIGVSPDGPNRCAAETLARTMVRQWEAAPAAPPAIPAGA